MGTDNVKPIYKGERKDFSWVGFGSGSGTNLRECAKAIEPDLIVTDVPDAGLLQLDELLGIPKYIFDGVNECGGTRKEYKAQGRLPEYEQRCTALDKRLTDMLRAHEKKHGRIDLVILGGYMRIVREPLLREYADRIINVHPADLGILNYNITPAIFNGYPDLAQVLETMAERSRVTVGYDSPGKGREWTSHPITATRKYIGGNAVYEAIKCGEASTRSSVIMVDSEMDHGEILVMGPSVSAIIDRTCEGVMCGWFEYVKSVAQNHQKQQKKYSDWPALVTALNLIADGRLGLGKERAHFGEWRRVYLDGKELPYRGFEAK